MLKAHFFKIGRKKCLKNIKDLYKQLCT